MTETAKSERWQDVIRVLEASTVPLGPKEVSDHLEWDYQGIRKLMREMKVAGALTQPKSGKYVVASPGRRTNAPRNAGIVIRDGKSGKDWLYVPFPDHLVVLNPLVIETEVDTSDLEFEIRRAVKRPAASE